MASPLLEIPGAKRRRSTARGSDRGRVRPVLSVDLTRRPLALERRRRRTPGAWYRSWSRRPASRLVRWIALLALLGGLVVAWRQTYVHITLPEGTRLAFPSGEAPANPMTFTVQGGGAARATLAGVPMGEVRRVGDTVSVTLPAGLPEGAYDLHVIVDRPFPFGTTTGRWTAVIDDRPPALVPDPPTAVELGRPVVLTGAVEPGAHLDVVDPSGTPWQLDAAPEGRFQVTFERAPAATVSLIATDAAGNRAEVPLVVPVAYPANTRAAHITAVGWSAAEVREPFLALVDRGVINTVQLDIKDESGLIGYDSQVPLARQIGAVDAQYDARQALDALHAKGVRVIGRIVAFRDPVLADWAWRNGRRQWVVQDPTGQPLSAYGGFANYADPEVRRYNLDLAAEAAALGFDEILWDYVRRPEGDPQEMLVPGLTGSGRTTGDLIVEFLDQARAELRPLGVYQGASVFGIAATRPENIGQPVDRIAGVVDYVAPMVYPSHYVDGECGVRSPKREPYAIVKCSLNDFREVMAGSPAALVPWLQDFSLDGVTYGAAEVAAQVRAAGEVGAAGFLLWSPAASYSYDGRG